VSYEIFHDALARPIVDWRTRKHEAELSARVDRERAEKERAQQDAIEAEEREARERQRKRVALAGVGVLLVVLLVLAGVLAAVQSDLAGERKDNAHSIQAVDRVFEISASPDFGESAAALASLEAYRLWPTVQARSQTLGVLQWNDGLPRIAVGHSRGVGAVAFWPDSSTVASAAFDGTVRLWDSQGRQLDVVRWDNAVANSVAVSPALGGDTRILAAALSKGAVDLWDVTEPENAVHVEKLPGTSTGQENAVAFSAGRSSMLAAGGKDGRIRLWDVNNPDRPRELAGRQALGGIRDLAFSANGRALVSASDGGEQLWALSGSGFSNREPHQLSSGPGSAAALGPDGAYAIGGRDGIALHSQGRDWFLRTTAPVRGVAFADHGRVLVSGGDDYSVTTWDARTGRQFGPPRTHGYFVVGDVAVSSDGRTIASGGADNLVKLWPLDAEDALASTVGDLSPGEHQGEFPSIRDLALGSGERVAAAGGAAGAFIWSLDDGNDPERVPQPLTRIPAPDWGPTYAVAYHGDLLAVSRGPTLGLCDTGSSRSETPDRACRFGGAAASGSSDTGLVSSLTGGGEALHTGVITSLAFARSGKLLASADEKGTLNLWAVDEEGTIEHQSRMPRLVPKGISEVAFSPTDPLLAAASYDGTVRVWDVSDPRDPSLVGEPLAHHEYQVVVALAFSPDGELLASGGEDQQIVLSEVRWEDEHDRGAITRTHSTLYQTNTIFALAFSPDGKTLASADGDAGACLYDVESRRAIGLCPQGHFGDLGSIYDVEFVGDGSRLLTAGSGNPIVAWDSILWNLDDEDETEQELNSAVCQLAGRNLTEAEWEEAFADTDLADDRHQTCSQYPLP
jgi:WD40 repeat protein